MLTPALANRQRKLAASRAAETAAVDNRSTTAYEQMLMQLAQHRRQLKLVQSLERKLEAKAAMLPAYESWVAGVLEHGNGAPDEVLMTVMVWRIDVGDLAGALPLARYALSHKLPLPDQYQRTLGCLLAEEFADTAEKSIEAGKPVDSSVLADVLALVSAEDMPDEVRGKLHRAHGHALNAEQDAAGALAAFERASQLNPKAGVKKLIETLTRQLRNQTASSAGNGG